MLSECIFELNSEDYTEFIFRDSYFANKYLENLEDYCVTKINSKWSVASVRNSIIGTPTYEKFGYSVYPSIYGLADIGALSKTGVLQIREQPVLGLRGNGTCVAVIDTGINWRHKAFINGGTSSKIRVLWDQESNEVYETDRINMALSGQDIDVPEDEIGHGTFMAGIACGNADPANSFSGVAPDAGIIVVKLKQAKNSMREFYSVKKDVPAYSEVDIMRAVQFVADYAENNRIPVSIVLGLGTSLGVHSGFSPLSDILADESDKVGRCITIAGGNEGNERLHHHGVTEGKIPASVELRIGRGEEGVTANVWSEAPFLYSLEIVSPSGQVAGRVPVRNGTVRLYFLFEDTTVFVYSRRYESISGANLIAIRFKKPAEGIWTLNLYNNSEGRGEFDIWLINRSFLTENTFFLISDPSTTILDPGNLSKAITVSAFDYQDGSSYFRNSRGYNWYGYVKPDFAAPGVDIIVPSVYETNRYEVRSGSSIAAAFFSGMAALLLEYGIVRDTIPYIRTSEIKSITIAGCERKDGLIYPNNIWGYGTVNLLNSFQRLRE